MTSKIEPLFERICGPLRHVSKRLAVGRCPSCGTTDSLFIDLKTGDWRCGRLPDGLIEGVSEPEAPQPSDRTVREQNA